MLLHVSGELFKIMADIDMIHVPYRGTAAALTDLLGGQVQMVCDNISTSIEHIRAGKLRPLAVTTAKRSEMLPDLPTVGDFLPGFEQSAFFGIGAPERRRPRSSTGLTRRSIPASPIPRSGCGSPRSQARPFQARRLWQAYCRGDQQMGQGDQARRHQAGVISGRYRR